MYFAHKVLIMNRLVSTIFIVFIITTSCHNNCRPVILDTIANIQDYMSNTDTSKTILFKLSDAPSIGKHDFVRTNKCPVDTICFIDISKSSNYIVPAIWGFEDIPEYVVISPNRASLQRIASKIKDGLVYIYQSGLGPGTDLIANRLELFTSLLSNKSLTNEELFKISCENDFIINYLLGVYYLNNSMKKESDEYYEKALTCFQVDNDVRMLPLVNEILKMDTSMKSYSNTINFCPPILELDIQSDEQQIKTFITIINNTPNNVCVFQFGASCSCISVSGPRAISANASATYSIIYNITSDSDLDGQYVYFITSENSHMKVIPIKGKSEDTSNKN